MTIEKTRKAFSLIEISIVILIIGIFIIGVVSAKHLIKKARITAAQSSTRSSPITGIVNNKLWIETSLAETALGEASKTGDLITSWADNSSNKNSISISAVGTGPIYSNSINDVQAVKFDANSSANHLQIDNAEFLNNSDYTIFIVEKRIAANSGVKNYLLGQDGAFAVGYETESSIIQTHSEVASADNQSNIEGLSAYSDKPRVLTFTHSSIDGNKIYINSTLANSDTTSTAKANLSGATALSTLSIGKGYNGEIGEIAIFDRNLKTSERTDIEDYLSKKWKAPNNRNSFATCTSGVLTSSGCESSCAVSVAGVSTTSVNDGDSGDLNCTVTGYSGVFPYTCSGAAITGSCSCDTANHYSLVSGSCKLQCSLGSVTGLGSGYVNSGSSSTATCSAGYSGTVNYSCNEGTLTVNSGSCTALPAVNCSGGTESSITVSGASYKLHVFSNVGSASLNCSAGAAGTIEVLIVGGGGGGGAQAGGGGGAGGYISQSLSISNTTYGVVVGAGGARSLNSNTVPGSNGNDSSFDLSGSLELVAFGGGGGGGDNGLAGGSGGGGNYDDGKIGGSGVSGQGNAGGNGVYVHPYPSGGGGGAGEAGQNGSGSNSGKGGDGLQNSITGTPTYYAGGGGGGGTVQGAVSGAGGNGGGGHGSVVATGSQNGQANTGGGGGGGINNGGAGGNGGSGVVIVRYVSP